MDAWKRTNNPSFESLVEEFEAWRDHQLLEPNHRLLNYYEAAWNRVYGDAQLMRDLLDEIHELAAA